MLVSGNAVVTYITHCEVFLRENCNEHQHGCSESQWNCFEHLCSAGGPQNMGEGIVGTPAEIC